MTWTDERLSEGLWLMGCLGMAKAERERLERTDSSLPERLAAIERVDTTGEETTRVEASMNPRMHRLLKTIQQQREDAITNNHDEAAVAFGICLDLIETALIAESFEASMTFLSELVGASESAKEAISTILEPLYEDVWIAQCRLLREARNGSAVG